MSQAGVGRSGSVSQAKRPWAKEPEMTTVWNPHSEAAELAREFKQACDDAVAECLRLTPPYRPDIWINMMERLGAVEAARRLISSGEFQSGFDRLVRIEGRPELTLEAAVLHDRWHPVLFSVLDREGAWWRLDIALRELSPAARTAAQQRLQDALGRPWNEILRR